MKLFLYILILLTTVSCSTPQALLRKGDLVFQVAETSGMSGAIAEATAWNDSLKFDHVGIIIKEKKRWMVIEASPKQGVVLTDWKDFLAHAVKIKGKPCVVVKRITTNFPLKKAIEQAKRHIGEEYDWTFLPDNGKMYCSELVYECYRDSMNYPLFIAHPMNFRNANGDMSEFWITLFEQQGLPIPQGVPGTNPNDMAKEPILKEVGRF